jgi:hypothetical protein
MFKCTEINTQSYEMMVRDKLKYARHGHSACSLGEKFIVVTGSRKENENAHQKCEQYNLDLDIWFEIPPLNEGRHYHASCSFKDRFIFVFCGISNASKKYINTIEVFDHNTKKAWNLVSIPPANFPARQGLGVAQMNNEEILIFGGFSGKFMKDTHIFNPVTNEMRYAEN